MSERKRKYSSMNIWLVIGVAVLVILLLVWMTIASMTGDTDVAAFVTPGVMSAAGALLF